MAGMRALLLEKYKEVMKVEDLAEMLRITKQTLYIQMAKGDFPIPYGKIGKHYLFNTQHVADWLEEPTSNSPLPFKNQITSGTEEEPPV